DFASYRHRCLLAGLKNLRLHLDGAFHRPAEAPDALRYLLFGRVAERETDERRRAAVAHAAARRRVLEHQVGEERAPADDVDALCLGGVQQLHRIDSLVELEPGEEPSERLL